MLSSVLVVAAAIVQDGCVLVGRRRTGGWEFPGGKVETGESCSAALVRELREELDVDVRPVREIGSTSDGVLELRLWLVEPTGRAPTASTDHDELRWVGNSGLDALGWLPADRLLLPAIRTVLSGTNGE